MARANKTEAKSRLSVNFGWYEEPREGDAKRERSLACIGGLVAIASDLRLGRQGLLDALRKRDLAASAELCRYHAENCLTRTYNARERVWELMCLKGGCSVRRFSDSVLRQLLQQLREDQAGLADCCQEFYQEIRSDIEVRNVGTHRHLVFLATSVGEQFFGDLDELLSDIDLKGRDAAAQRRVLRSALKAFVEERVGCADRVADLLYRLCRLFS